MAGKKEQAPQVPDGYVQLIVTEDAAADFERSMVKEIERAKHKINLHRNNFQQEIEALQTATNSLRSINPEHNLLKDISQMSLGLEVDETV